MNVRDVVDLVHQVNDDWSRLKLLGVINTCYGILMCHSSKLTQAFDADGGDAKITPTVSPFVVSDAYIIDRVYCDGAPYLHIGTVSGTSVVFKPNELNKEYRIRYYKRPSKYTSENQVFAFPEEHIDLFEALCNAYIEYKENGDFSSYTQQKSYITKQFKHYLARNYQPTSLTVYSNNTLNPEYK